jgi:hypothetical protein
MKRIMVEDYRHRTFGSRHQLPQMVHAFISRQGLCFRQLETVSLALSERTKGHGARSTLLHQHKADSSGAKVDGTR